MKLNKLVPKVLIGCPTSERHKEVFKKWIKHLEKLTYPFDVCIVETSLTSDNYKIIKNLKVNGKKVKVIRHKWNPNKQHPVQMLADAREKYRKYFLENDYSFLFHLDDDIFVPVNAIQKLVSYNLDAVGFYVHVFYKPNQVPCLLKSGFINFSGDSDYFSFSEIDEYKKFVDKFRNKKLTKSEKNLIPFLIKDLNKPNLFSTYGVGLGCLMTSKKLMETVPFRTHPTFVYGEDLWFFNEANDKNFKFYCDSDIRCKHLNTEWNSIVTKSKRKMNFFLAYGPSDAKEAVIVNRK